ncbi:MAG: hydroxymethylbilane synthase [Flavobacteriales bacterium]
MPNAHIRIGTRGSDLALWQANHVKAQLEALGCTVELNIIQTQGDRIQDLSFDKLEGKGFFTKEIESALLDQSIDLAVHSHKDLETTPPSGLVIAAVSEREDPRDLLLIRPEAHDPAQPLGLKIDAIVGTSSARRQSILRHFRNDIVLKELRGNVPTRIEKLRRGAYDAIVLAKAGVSRLGLDTRDLMSLTLDPKTFVPAPAQGVLGLQVREKDESTYAWVRKLNYVAAENAIAIEREVLKNMDGGCQLPLGVYNDGESVHVAYGKSKQDPAVLFTFSLEKDQPLVQTIVSTLNAL